MNDVEKFWRNSKLVSEHIPGIQFIVTNLFSVYVISLKVFKHLDNL